MPQSGQVSTVRREKVLPCTRMTDCGKYHRKADTQGLIHELQSVNQHHLLISRNEAGLMQVLGTVERLDGSLQSLPRQDAINMEAFRLYV